MQLVLEQYMLHTPTCCPTATAAAVVANKVYELIGGPVEHCGNDDRDLPDDIKLLQRLYSMNVMTLEGYEPDVTLWQVRPAPQGTATAELCHPGISAVHRSARYFRCKQRMLPLCAASVLLMFPVSLL